jgi:hypothetical protein
VSFGKDIYPESQQHARFVRGKRGPYSSCVTADEVLLQLSAGAEMRKAFLVPSDYGRAEERKRLLGAYWSSSRFMTVLAKFPNPVVIPYTTSNFQQW